MALTTKVLISARLIAPAARKKKPAEIAEGQEENASGAEEGGPEMANDTESKGNQDESE